MTYVHVRELAARQRDLVAAWQLRARGWSWGAVRWAAREWHAVHNGVYALTHAPLRQEQVWMAATLTAPATYLSDESAGACFGICSYRGRLQRVVRTGDGGKRHHDRLLVRYTTTLAGDVGDLDGIPITSPERTLIDLAARVDPARALREARRLELVTHYSLAVSLEKHRRRRGAKRLAELNDHYSGLPYSRCRSNAEAKALETLHDAGAPPSRVNARIGGEEADLIYDGRRLIIEIDGAQYHGIGAEDARKQQVWKDAGYTVRRIGSDLVYAAPHHLVALLDL